VVVEGLPRVAKYVRSQEQLTSIQMAAALESLITVSKWSGLLSWPEEAIVVQESAEEGEEDDDDSKSGSDAVTEPASFTEARWTTAIDGDKHKLSTVLLDSVAAVEQVGGDSNSPRVELKELSLCLDLHIPAGARTATVQEVEKREGPLRGLLSHPSAYWSLRRK